MEQTEEPIWKEHHRADAERIRRALLAANYQCPTVVDAEMLWHQYSDEQWATDWLGLPEEDEQIVARIVDYCDPLPAPATPDPVVGVEALKPKEVALIRALVDLAAKRGPAYMPGPHQLLRLLDDHARLQSATAHREQQVREALVKLRDAHQGQVMAFYPAGDEEGYQKALAAVDRAFTMYAGPLGIDLTV